jgi:hypothetical protein
MAQAILSALVYLNKQGGQPALGVQVAQGGQPARVRVALGGQPAACRIALMLYRLHPQSPSVAEGVGDPAAAEAAAGNARRWRVIGQRKEAVELVVRNSAAVLCSRKWKRKTLNAMTRL